MLSMINADQCLVFLRWFVTLLLDVHNSLYFNQQERNYFKYMHNAN